MTAADKQNSSWFSRNKLGKKTGSMLILGFLTVMLVSVGVSQSSSTPSVSIGQNGIQVNAGGIDMGGNDLSDGGTTIWDASSNQIASAVVDYSAATASDVGLGDVENEAAVAESGDTMTGQLTVTAAPSIVSGSGNDLYLGSENDAILEGDRGNTFSRVVAGNGQVLLDGDTSSGVGTNCIVTNGDMSCDGSITAGNSGNGISTSGTGNTILKSENNGVALTSAQNISFLPDDDDTATFSTCEIYRNSNDEASLSCPGAKNWVENLENGSEAVYTSQESPEVRAVYEGKAVVDGRTRINLPSHYSKTVSDFEPKLRATATVQGKLAYSAVIEKTDDYIVLDSSEPATVNYRITGVREGYEDKQVVREKE